MFSALTLAAYIAAAPVPAGGVEIKNNLKVGDEYYVKTTLQLEQTVAAPGQPAAEQAMDQSTIVRFKVLESATAKTVVAMTYLDSTMTAKGLPSDPDALKRLKGVTLTATFDEKFAVTKLDGYDKFLDAMAGDNAATRAAISAAMPIDTLKRMYVEIYGWVPGRLVKAGDNWKRADVYSLGPLGGMDMNLKYSLTGVTDGIAEVAVDGEAKYVAPGAAGGAGPFKITASTLKADSYKGTQRFDLKSGRMKSAQADMAMSGTLTISVNGKEIALDMKQKLTTKSAVTATNPLDEK